MRNIKNMRNKGFFGIGIMNPKTEMNVAIAQI